MSLKGSLAFFAVIAVAVLVFWKGGFLDKLSGGISLKPGKTTSGKVVRTVDGDTLDIQTGGKTVRVRLIGIDTPESVRPGVPVECGSKQASAFMKKLAAGEAVTLESDPDGDAEDSYGRTLAYVYPQGSSRTLQEKMLESGWAELYVFEDRRFSKYGEFKEAADQGKADELGVWRLCDGDFHSASTGAAPK